MMRLFVALDLPRELRDGIEAWGAHELTDPALRPVPAEKLHMTLCFLGSTPDERVQEAIELVAAIAPRPVAVRVACQPVAKPPRRPSLIALEAEAPEAEALADEVRRPLVAHGLAREERRPFWPHLTIARVRSEPKGGSRGRRPRRVERLPGPLPEALGGEFRAVRLCLYRSMMRRDGSQYVPLLNVDLR